MTPATLAHIVRVVTIMAKHRGRTVPAIREGGPWDGRAELQREEPKMIDRDALATAHYLLGAAADEALIAYYVPDKREYYIRDVVKRLVEINAIFSPPAQDEAAATVEAAE